MTKVLVLNGPNIQRLGTREPEIYGSDTFEDLKKSCVEFGKTQDFEIDFRQTDDEATIIKWLHEAADNKLPVIINPAAFTHTSVALRDAIGSVNIPFYEVHLSNVHAREEFRHKSLFSDKAVAVICGLGKHGYAAALEHIIKNN